MSKNNNLFWCRGCYNEWRGGSDIACTCDVTFMHWFVVNFEKGEFFEYTEENILSLSTGRASLAVTNITPRWFGVGNVGRQS